jgi:hypothetical protein
VPRQNANRVQGLAPEPRCLSDLPPLESARIGIRFETLSLTHLDVVDFVAVFPRLQSAFKHALESPHEFHGEVAVRRLLASLPQRFS